MRQGIRDEYVLGLLKKEVRYDYANSDLTAAQIAAKHNIGMRTMFYWVKGIKRKAKRDNPYISMRFTETDLEDLILAVMEAEKSAKDNLAARYNVLEDRLATMAEELYKRRNHNE